MDKCNLCPKKCNADRSIGVGFCGVGTKIKLARAALHYWEEPCISMEKGSGAIFFSGCNMKCCFCQNREISRGMHGVEISDERFYDILFELKDKGAENINLVTATHYADKIVPIILEAKNSGLDLPVVYNTSSYEDVETLKRLEKIVDIYLPDYKYYNNDTAMKFSGCKDYVEICKNAIDEMFRQKSKCVFDKSGKMLSGMIVRHLVLPGHLDESKKIIEHLYNRYGDSIYLSIMSQFTPVNKNCDFPELNRKVTESEYNQIIDFAVDLGIENAFVQDGEAAEESFIPSFDFEGVI